jgi:hypothetical protein
MSDIPISVEIDRQSEQPPPVSYPLSAEFISLVSGMAATILAGTVAMARADLTPDEAAKLAVELSVRVANEIREYRLVGGRAVRQGKPSESENDHG